MFNYRLTRILTGLLMLFGIADFADAGIAGGNPSPKNMPSAIVVASSADINAASTGILSRYVRKSAHPISIDYERSRFETVEGGVFALSDAFSERSIQGSALHKALAAQYNDDLLIAVWSREKSSNRNAAWSVSTIELEIRAAFFDLKSGALLQLMKDSVRITDPDGEKAQAEAISRLLDKGLPKAVEKALERLAPAGASMNRILLQITKIDEKQFLSTGGAIKEMASAVKNASLFRDEYSPKDRLLTLRLDYTGDANEFYVDLYRRFGEKGLLKNFVLSPPDKNRIVARYVSPDEITILFGNISHKTYRKLGPKIESIVRAAAGASEVSERFAQNHSTLSYSLVSTNSPFQIDQMLWEKIKSEALLKKIVQDNITGNRVSFFYLGDAASGQRTRVELRNLPADAYRSNGRSFIEMVQSIAGMEDVAYRYDEPRLTLSISFDNDKASIYEIDEEIWRLAEKSAAFGNLAMGAVEENVLVYQFPAGSASSAGDVVTIYLARVPGQKYGEIGPAFQSLLAAASGVGAVSYSYDFKAKTIVYNAAIKDVGIAELDQSIAIGARSNALLKHVARGPGFANRIVYYYYDQELSDRNQPSVSLPGDEGDVSSLVQPGFQEGGNLPSIVARLDPSVVIVYTQSDADGMGHGSGFFVSENGYILTNRHVIDGADAIVVQTYAGDRFRANVIKSEPDLDLALLKLKSRKPFAAVTIGESGGLVKGQQVIVIGTPLSSEFENSVTTGIISGFDRTAGLFQISAPIFPGNSGGPVINSSGEVIGVARAVAVSAEATLIRIGEADATLVTPRRESSIGLVIPIDYARSLLELAR